MKDDDQRKLLAHPYNAVQKTS